MIKHRLHTSPAQAGRDLKKQITQIILLSTLYSLLSTLCIAQPISSTELINNAKFYDGKTVVYEGEVIGDIMQRGDFAWINVNDANSAIGIWLPVSLVKEIVYKGSYKSKGDWIEVTGTLQRACPVHGGDLDIHAQYIRKIVSGRPTLERLNLSKRNQVIILFGVLCLIWILTLLKRK